MFIYLLKEKQLRRRSYLEIGQKESEQDKQTGQTQEEK